MITQHTLWKQLAVSTALALAVACGGGGGPTGPSGGGSGGGSGPGPVGATITIGANGAVSPASVTITSGQSVTFVNNHSEAHDMASNPHPVHTDCPSVNGSAIGPGQSRTTNAFTTARTCGYHDHMNDSNASLRGSIVVQ